MLCGQRARTHKTHVAANYIKKLGQFIQLPSSHESPKPSHSRVRRPRHRWTSVTSAVNHCTELQDSKLAPVLSRTSLAKQYSSSRSQLHEYCDRYHHRQEQDQQQNCSNNVKY